MRESINEALKVAVKSKDALRVSTLRLINAAIKDQDIALRGSDKPDGVSDEGIIDILAKMVKQRTEAAETYEQAGRQELADKEREEIKIIAEFLPAQLDEAQMQKAVDKTITALKAKGLKDMGKVMGTLKANYAGQMDFAKASALVKERLG